MAPASPRRGAAPLMVGAALLLSACTGAQPASPGATPAASTTSVAATSPGAPDPSAPSAPPAPTAGVPTAEQLADARALVEDLSLRELAGQVIVARYSGFDGRAAADLVRRLHLGGVITFDVNVPSGSAQATGATLRRMTARVHDAVRADGRAWPAVIAVDQEGGPVARLGPPVVELPASMAHGAADSAEVSSAATRVVGRQLRSLGFTMVFAPDVDVTIGAADPTIGIRSPGSAPRRAARVAAAMTTGYNDAGIVSVAKHFPGHGSVTTDSHIGLPVQGASRATLQRRDWPSFVGAVEAGIPAVMMAHIVTKAIDPARPATLSRAVTTGVLRRDLGFDGLVVTDALEMAAITQRYGSAQAAVLALAAGADVLLMPADVEAAVQGIVTAVRSGRLDRDRLIEAAARGVATVLRAEAVPRVSADDLPSGRAASLALARAAVTQVQGQCGARLVRAGLQVVGGTPTDRARLAAAARAAGLGVGSGPVVVLVGGQAYRAAGSAASGTGTSGGRIVVALDTPYPLAQVPRGGTALAVFGRTKQSFTALVEVLEGATAPGSLPVRVGRHPVGTGC